MALEPVAERKRLREWVGTGKLTSGEFLHELDDRHRAALRIGHDPAGHVRGDRTRCDGSQQLSGVIRLKTTDAKGWDTLELQVGIGHLAEPEEKHDLFGVQSSGYEGEGIERLLIDPLCVVDHAQKATRRGRLGEQGQDPEPDDQSIIGRRIDEPERGAQRCTLAARQAGEAGQEGHE
jgi:hypothetical protein